LLGAAALIAGALLLVGQSAAATQASYQIASLKQEQARLSATHDQMQAQLAQDQAANRVALAAQELGMTHPSRWQYVNGSHSPIALRTGAPDSSHPGVFHGVLAALSAVIGQPVDPSSPVR
jgi:hypothetical protein